MTDESRANLDDRLAQLAARRAQRTQPRSTPEPANTAEPAITAARSSRGTPKRRSHPAAASRIFVTGLATSAFLTIVATLGAAATAAPAKRPTLAGAPP
ncbi:MAG TPA: hypothetical protein VFR41_00020, partial [Acidimicrobiia bacterium]|nr:hypothetical protein [Acidimicrobiia bacterium]